MNEGYFSAKGNFQPLYFSFIIFFWGGVGIVS